MVTNPTYRAGYKEIKLIKASQHLDAYATPLPREWLQVGK